MEWLEDSIPEFWAFLDPHILETLDDGYNSLLLSVAQVTFLVTRDVSPSHNLSSGRVRRIAPTIPQDGWEDGIGVLIQELHDGLVAARKPAVPTAVMDAVRHEFLLLILSPSLFLG